jgi:hypothetical protein
MVLNVTKSTGLHAGIPKRSFISERLDSSDIEMLLGIGRRNMHTGLHMQDTRQWSRQSSTQGLRFGNSDSKRLLGA